MTKKSDHKHEYDLVEIKDNGWFTHEKKCKICGHINDKVRIVETSNYNYGNYNYGNYNYGNYNS